MSYFNYDPKLHDMILTFGGVPFKVSDYGEDVKFKIVQDKDLMEESTGVDGDVEVSVKHGVHADIEINLLEGSPLNAIFTLNASLQQTFGIAWVDRNFSGDIGGHTSKAFFKKIADKEVKAKAGTRTWSVKALNFKYGFAL